MRFFILPLLFLITFAYGSDTMNLKTIDGKVIEIKITEDGFVFKNFKNKVVLLDLFGPRCPYCVRSRGALTNMQSKYKKDLQIIAIQVQGSVEDIDLKKFTKKHKMDYPVVNRKEADELMGFIQINTDWKGQIPYMLLFDKKGTMKKKYLGLTDENQLELDINSSI